MDAIERSLQSLGHILPLDGRPPRQARIILFYRNELRVFLKAELEKATGPLTVRELARILCQMEGKRPEDKRLLSDVAKRVSGALGQMKDLGQVTRGGPKRNGLWQLRQPLQ